MKCVLLVLSATNAFALDSFSVEPYLGYGTGNTKQDDSSNLSGLVYGIKAGYSTMGVGLDWSISSHHLKLLMMWWIRLLAKIGGVSNPSP